MRNIFYLSLLFGVVSCRKAFFFQDYRNTADGWPAKEKIEFQLPKIYNLKEDRFNIYIHVRNNDFYPYANIFLIATLKDSVQIRVSDTLEYAMASPDGTWLGSGFGVLKESKLWWKEGYQFPSNGVYTIQIEQAMRNNGQEAGIELLKGIVDVGVVVEKLSTD